MKQDTLLTVGAVVENHKGVQFTLRDVTLQFNAYDGIEVMLNLWSYKCDLYRSVKLTDFEQKVRNGTLKVLSSGK